MISINFYFEKTNPVAINFYFEQEMKRISASILSSLLVAPLFFPRRCFVDHYARLGVPRDATQTDIKQAYRRLALKCHPDVVNADSDGGSNKAQQVAEARFRQVSEAYEVLSSATARKTLDEQLNREEEKKSFGRAALKERPSPIATRSTRKTSFRGFVRKDADRVFAEAFDGKTVADVLFNVRFRAKWKKKVPREGEKAEEELLRSDLAFEQLQRAAKRFEVQFGAEALNNAKIYTSFSRTQQPPAPPSSYMPFHPFQRVPEGVTAKPIPTLGKVTNIGADNKEDVAAMVVKRHAPGGGSKGALFGREELRSSEKCQDAAIDMHNNIQWASNQGHVYSYQRIF